MRRRHPRWFAKYNYVLGAALDGGSQVRSIHIYLMLTSFIKPYRTGHDFHSFVCCSGSFWKASLIPSLVRTLFCKVLKYGTHVLIFLIIRWGANQGGWSSKISSSFCSYTNSQNFQGTMIDVL
jgi:hypothetical protein